jgi:hypothetical protein
MKMTYKGIVFDDFVDQREEYGSYYVCMCRDCRDKHKNILGENRIDNNSSGLGVCSVDGCWNEYDCYVDFDMNEVEFE